MKKYDAEQLYAEIERKGPRSKSYRDPGYDPMKSIQDTFIRKPFVYNYSWAIPSREAIKEIVCFVGTDKCLEIGAGRGLWAFLLQEAGVSIIATDNYSEHTRNQIPDEIQMYQDLFDDKPPTFIGSEGPQGLEGPSGCTGAVDETPIIGEDEPNILKRMGLKREDLDYEDRLYTTVENLDSAKAMENCTCLMVCWGRYGGYEEFKGNKIVFIGEDEGGCTTEPPPSDQWELVKRVEIKRWNVARDFLGLYRRKP